MAVQTLYNNMAVVKRRQNKLPRQHTTYVQCKLILKSVRFRFTISVSSVFAASQLILLMCFLFPICRFILSPKSKSTLKEYVATRKINLFRSRVTNAVKMFSSFGNWHLLAGEKGCKRSEKKTYNVQNPLHWLPSKATPTAFL